MSTRVSPLAGEIVRSDFDPFSLGDTGRSLHGTYAEAACRGTGCAPDAVRSSGRCHALPRPRRSSATISISAAQAAPGSRTTSRRSRWRPPSIVLEADPPPHTRTRAVLARILSPGAMRRLADDFKAKAATLIDGLVERGSFDAIKDIAEVFPGQRVSRRHPASTRGP